MSAYLANNKSSLILLALKHLFESTTDYPANIPRYKGKNKELKSTLRTETQYQKHKHVRDAQLRPNLYAEEDGEHILLHTED